MLRSAAFRGQLPTHIVGRNFGFTWAIFRLASWLDFKMKTHPVLLFAAGLFNCGCLLGASTSSSTSSACGVDGRMLRYPDVSANQIAFVYAGDIWVAPKTGGDALRLSSPKGEEMFPRFSPDGSRIAYSANYDGNMDIYVVPATGGLPRRLTYHGAPDRMLEWYPDGRSILFATSRTSEKDRFNHLYKSSADDG